MKSLHVNQAIIILSGGGLLVLAILLLPTFIVPRSRQVFSPVVQCRINILTINEAKQVYAKTHGLMRNGVIVSNITLTPDQLAPIMKDGKFSLSCPSGGKYLIGLLDESATCSLLRHNPGSTREGEHDKEH